MTKVDWTVTEFVRTCKALADPSRFELFHLLLTHDFCVGALAAHLKITEAAVSQHLRQLREAGLVKGEKRGYWTHYRVEREKLGEWAERVKGLTMLPPCPQGICIRTKDPKTHCQREGGKMYACKCEHPEKLKGKPEACSPQQIRACHGTKGEHPCVPKGGKGKAKGKKKA